MSAETVETLVIGAGQAGIAMSEHLGRRQSPHLVLERARIAERWRSERWDSLVANGPAWHDRFPGMTFPGIDPDSFASRGDIVDYFERYAGQIEAPIRSGVAVRRLTALPGQAGFRAETADGVIEARNVVAATGPFQLPIIPAMVPAEIPVLQMHSNAYRNPARLPEGAVMVIGAGSSGTQIADELLRAGRRVYLSIGPHNRPPRSYRGHDFCWWLGALGKWDAEARAAGMEHVTIAVSGAYGGQTIDFRRLAGRGMTLVGRTRGFAGGRFSFADDLETNILRGDADYLSILDEADAYARREGLDLPEEPESRVIAPLPACVAQPLRDLSLAEAGITTIIWATGYALDFGWLEVDTFTAAGQPIHRRGVSTVPGLYFLGLPWLSHRSSSFIWGVWKDAAYLAEHIATRADTLAVQFSARENPA
jgi:putative flavoprotein involved in K+ transport